MQAVRKTHMSYKKACTVCFRYYNTISRMLCQHLFYIFIAFFLKVFHFFLKIAGLHRIIDEAPRDLYDIIVL